MSRIPLKATVPLVDEARDANTANRQTFIQLAMAYDDALDARNAMLISPDATLIDIQQANDALTQARDSRDQARSAYDETRITYQEQRAAVEARQTYLDSLKQQRDPVHQLQTFPDKCNTDLTTLLAYDIQSFNATLANVPTGDRHWQLTAPATIATNDDTLRQTILVIKDKYKISYHRWIRNEEAYGHIFDTLTEAQFAVNRHIKT